MDLILPLPPSINRTYGTTKTGRFYMKAPAKKWLNDVKIQLSKAGLKPFPGYVEIWLTYYYPTLAGDVTNREKITLDSMQGYVFKNDSQVLEAHSKKRKDAKNPRLVVRILSTDKNMLSD